MFYFWTENTKKKRRIKPYVDIQHFTGPMIINDFHKHLMKNEFMSLSQIYFCLHSILLDFFGFHIAERHKKISNLFKLLEKKCTQNIK